MLAKFFVKNKKGELAFSTIVIAIVALAVLGILLYFVFKAPRPPTGTIDPSKLEFLKVECKHECTLTKSVDSLDEFERSEYCTLSKTEDLDNDNQIEDTEKDLKCWGLIGERCTATLVAKVNYCVPSALAPSNFNPPDKFEFDTTANDPGAIDPDMGCGFDYANGNCIIKGSVDCGDFGGDVCNRIPGCKLDAGNCVSDSGINLDEAARVLCDEISRNVEVSINEERCPGYT